MRPDLRTYVVGDEGGRAFGPGPAELLELVGSLGSLRAAAQRMRMAYTKAVRIVRDAEATFGFALTERRVGGAGGGGSRLTPEARDLLERDRAFERASERALEESFASCFAGVAGAAPRAGCVVMASGEGRRFGAEPGGKLVAPLADATVLGRTLSALPADLLDIVVVTRWEPVRRLCRGLGLRCVEPAGPHRSDTVRAGLEALGQRACCLFVPGDQPLLTPGSVRAVVRCALLEPGAVVRLSWDGRAAGPIAWPARDLPALAALAGDDGGRSLLASGSDAARRTRLVEAADAWELADVDTPDDLARLAGALLWREETR